MLRKFDLIQAIVAVLAALSVESAAMAQKAGGILKMYNLDSPASMSIYEEANVAAEGPMMGVFNNLVLFDQHVKQKQPTVDCAGPGQRLVMERGWNRADISSCTKGSDGTTASRSPPVTFSAPGI